MRFQHFLASIFCLLATFSFAEEFDRPIPQAQTATAEVWFAIGSIALVLALIFVQRLVARS